MGEVLIFHAGSGEEWKRLSGHVAEVSGVAWRPDGARLLTGGRDYAVKIWDVGSGAELLHLLWVLRI